MSPRTATVCSHCLRGQHDQCTVPDTCGCATCNPPVDAGVLWEDPPKNARGRKPGSEKVFPVEALKLHPGRWAKVETYAKPTSAAAPRAASGRASTARWPPPHFEVRTARVGDGSALYMRYVGPGGKA